MVQKRCKLTRQRTWKLTMSFPSPGASCPSGFWRFPRSGAQLGVLPWQTKTDPDGHPPSCPQPSPSGRPLYFCGFIVWSSWDLNFSLNLPSVGFYSHPQILTLSAILKSQPSSNPNHISHPQILTLYLSRPIAWALISGLERDFGLSVPSALVTSLDQTLILAKALSPWGPNPYV